MHYSVATSCYVVGKEIVQGTFIKNNNALLFSPMSDIIKLRKCLSRKTTALLYKQLVRPHLEYCDFLIDSSLRKHIDKFERFRKGP